MVREFTGKNEWAIILGASSGLGLATAKKLAAHGMNLCLIYRARKADNELILKTFDEIARSNKVEAIYFNVDATRADKRSEVINTLNARIENQGAVKTLIHSIAKGNLKPMVDDETAELQNDDFHLTIEHMAINLYDWTKAVFGQGMFAEDARILSFTSEGNTKAWKNYAAVSAAKVVLESITRNIALEFAMHGIRANCIQAGVTDTTSFKMIPGSDEIRSHTLKRNPFGRLTSPEDVANVVYLLVKKEAAWINGAIIPVNGGEHLS